VTVSYATPTIANVTGCQAVRSGSSARRTLNCVLGSVITIEGANFGASGGDVRIDNQRCANVARDPLAPHSRVFCTLPAVRTTNRALNDLPIALFNAAGQAVSAPAVTLSYVACPPGTTPAGSSGCAGCPAGSFSAVVNGACVSCGAGSFSSPGSSSCRLCAPGTWSASSSASCSACGPRQFASAFGQISCGTCPPGFKPNAGATGCEPCPAGTAGGGQDDCSLCSSGSSSAGAVACTPCPAGSSASADRKSCIPCPAGSAANPTGTGCVACAPGFASGSTGSFNCAPCDMGFYSDVTGLSSCLACQPGFVTVEPQQSACTKCGLNLYAPVNGSARCLPCPLGTDGDDGAAQCGTYRVTDRSSILISCSLTTRTCFCRPLLPGPKSKRGQCCLALRQLPCGWLQFRLRRSRVYRLRRRFVCHCRQES
jgi:hypothetical protein